MIISINSEKACDKIQHPFMIKALMKLGIEGMYLNIIKAIYGKPIANIILNMKKWKISSKVRNETKMSTLPTLIQYSFVTPSQINKEEEIKGIQIGKKEVKLSLFVDHMILFIKDPKNSTQKLRHHRHF
jgi:hypothetical protein